MTVLHFDPRALIPWPGGANSSDTLISGHHWNLTTLLFWNYTLYDNQTISNDSWCQLTGPQYAATTIWANGTFVNGTSCYTPLKPIGLRSAVGIGLAVVYGLCLVVTMFNLGRHGKMHLPAEKRFYPIGRRWQWYWAIFISACALVGLFFGVDVDRYPIQELPIVIEVFFWYLMQMGVTAMVWESVRHWGSWKERQFIDPNPFVLQQTDKRGMFEFWLPLFFYLWLWMNFFMIIPRNWTPIMLQRSPDQTLANAEPAAQDIRFKLAGFFLIVCWLTINVSLWHSIRHYEPKNRGWIGKNFGFVKYVPIRFVLLVPLLGAVIVYQIMSAFNFRWSPVNTETTNFTAMYVGGYTPTLLILIIHNIAGFMRPNEDRELNRQRRERGEAIDASLGLVRKPAWWKRVNGEMPVAGMADQLLRNVKEVGGGRATGDNVDRMAEGRAAAPNATPSNIEMGEISPRPAQPSGPPNGTYFDNGAPPPYTPYGGKSDRRKQERAMEAAAGILFPNSSPSAASGSRMDDLPPPPPPPPASDRPDASSRSRSVASGVSTSGQPQQIRSMLDV